jgi:BirA family biotin operon repressor/biotin-[acetyl-CoA-carboxylase] ligase
LTAEITIAIRCGVRSFHEPEHHPVRNGWFDQYGSAKQAKLGADEGLCIIADQQTAGKGRHGRTWVSEKDSGLYFSIVLRPKLELRFLPLVTLTAGVAVHDALKEFGVKPDIKWVNDILVGDKRSAASSLRLLKRQRGLPLL